MKFNRERPAFTLIELLVVIGILSLLTGIILPSFFRARELARKTPCLNNCKNIGMGVVAYSTDNFTFVLPRSQGTSGPTGAKGLFWCDIASKTFDASVTIPAPGDLKASIATVSKAMICPSFKDKTKPMYLWNSPNITLNPPNPNQGYWDTGSPATALRIGSFSTPSAFCAVIEGQDSSGNCWTDPNANGVLAGLAANAPHLGELNAIMLDGSVHSFTQNDLTGYTGTSYPFNKP